VVAGKIVEGWAETDGVSLLQQPGAIPLHSKVSPEVREQSGVSAEHVHGFGRFNLQNSER